MVMSKLMTADELFALGEEAGRVELIEGERHEMSPASGQHGAVGMRLGMALSLHVYGNDLGEMFNSETGFIVKRDPDTVLSPDLSFVAGARIPADGVWKGFVPLSPDLVVEIESPSNSVGEQLRKVSMYLLGGSRLVWVVRPETLTVTVFRPGFVEEVLTQADTLTGGDVLPGFAVPLADIFKPLAKRGAESG